MKYEIWQLKAEKLRAYGFMDYEWATEHGFDFNHYEKVYEGDNLENLEDIFFHFNMRRPTDFRGHSLSVSDIVVLNGEKFYCDRIGWKKLD